MAGLVPQIIAELKKPPPVGQAGQPSPPDPSFPYKDAAYAMLTAERTNIITDENLTVQGDPLSGWTNLDVTKKFNEPGSGSVDVRALPEVMAQLQPGNRLGSSSRRRATYSRVGLWFDLSETKISPSESLTVPLST